MVQFRCFCKVMAYALHLYSLRKIASVVIWSKAVVENCRLIVLRRHLCTRHDVMNGKWKGVMAKAGEVW